MSLQSTNLAKNNMELYIEINNKEPLELLDLTMSLPALGNQFNKFVNENGSGQASSI